MRDYLVTWTIDIEADNPTEAAARALIIQRDNDPANTATVFNVSDKETGKYTEVDLTPDAAEEFTIAAKPAAPSLGKLSKLFDRVQGDPNIETMPETMACAQFRKLAMALLTRVAEIDSQITKSAYYTGDDSAIKRGDFDTPPTGDDYNLLFDAIMDEIIALLPPES